MEELELLREMDQRSLQVQRAAEELVQACLEGGLVNDVVLGRGYFVDAESLLTLQQALKVVHDYALAVATGRVDNSPEGLRGEQDPQKPTCCVPHAKGGADR